MTREPRADLHLGSSLLGVLVSPRATLPLLVAEPTPRAGSSAVAVLGIAWTALSILLWNQGRPAHFVLLPIAPEDWYLVQAFVVLPVLTGLWWVFASLADRICRAVGGAGSEPGVRAALGFAFAAPTLVHVVAELIGLVAGGPDVLTRVAMISGPLAALWVWALSAAALRIAHGVPRLVAAGAALAGLLVQALLGALVLR